MAVDLNNLPELNLLEKDYADLLAELKSFYKEMTGVYPLPTYPETFLLEIAAYLGSLLFKHINAESRENLLAYAKGERLDHLGALLGVERLPAQPARCTVKFILEPRGHDLLIPAGTILLAKDGREFKLAQDLLASPSTTEISGTAEALEPGPEGNGYLPGEINFLKGPLPYVISVENVTVTYGGTDVEDDDRFRERIRLAPEAFSTAGSRMAYIFHAKSAHQDIVDVEVVSPSPGVVRVYPLLKDGIIPGDEILNLVKTYLSDEKRRPLTDYVEVLQPEPVDYNLVAEVIIYKDSASLLSQIQTEAHNRVKALAYKWQEKLGRDIVPEEFIQTLQSIPGVYRATVSSPTYQKLEKWQFPRLSSEPVISVSVGDE